MNTFSLICLVFGLLCGLLCAVVDLRDYFVKLRDINHAAAMRRVLSPDTRPLQYMDNSYPWQHDEWRKL